MKFPALLIGLSLVLFSCKKSDEISILEGFYDVSDSRNFVGSGMSSVNSRMYEYSLEVAGVEKEKLTLYDLFEEGTSLEVLRDGGSLTIESQSLGSGKTISGNGSINDLDEIVIYYSVSAPEGVSTCVVSGAKTKS